MVLLVWLVVELFAGLAVLGLCLATPLVGWLLARASRHNTGRPVLVVHGFGMLSGSMLVLGLRLARAGCGPVAAVGYLTLGSRSRAVARIARRAAALARASGAGRVDVVAHSLGGLLSRAARAEGAPVGRIVTLGTPHRGVF